MNCLISGYKELILLILSVAVGWGIGSAFWSLISKKNRRTEGPALNRKDPKMVLQDPTTRWTFSGKQYRSALKDVCGGQMRIIEKLENGVWVQLEGEEFVNIWRKISSELK